MNRWQTKEQLTDLLCGLVHIPSISGTPAENDMAAYIIAELAALPYFQKHPDQLKQIPTIDGTRLVTALVKSTAVTKKTVVLISHFDVVGVDDYGEWQPQAFDTKAMTQIYRDQDRAKLPEAVCHDLETGNWLFARGVMDMKCGIALHMSLIEQACDGQFDGNLLLLSVPDEEANSSGMRAAIPALLAIAEQYGLEYSAVLNSEPVFARYPGDKGNHMYMGSIGKALPGFYCYGQETHVGEPYAGLNANYMASLVTCEMEWNRTFCEFSEEESTPPPTNLIFRDLKRDYSVQIPHRTVTLFNLFVQNRTIRDNVSLLLDAARSAAERIEEALRQAAKASRSGVECASDVQTKQPASQPLVRVFTYEQLINHAERIHGSDAVTQLLQLAADEARQAGNDDRDTTITLVDRIAILCKELAPMIVLFFAPPFYPSVSSKHNALIQHTVSATTRYASEKYGVELKPQHYFGGISDLSYVGTAHIVDSLADLPANMPMWSKGYTLPLEAMERFSVPVLNLGPIGRDAHQRTERLDVDYAFNILPDLLQKCIDSLFECRTDSVMS